MVISCGTDKGKKTSGSTKKTDIQIQREREELRPIDSLLSEKYDRSCVTCHANPDALAPLVGNKFHWDKLIKEKGMDGLLENSIKGSGAMPARGNCLDCTDEELEAIIKFMAAGHNL